MEVQRIDYGKQIIPSLPKEFYIMEGYIMIVVKAEKGDCIRNWDIKFLMRNRLQGN